MTNDELERKISKAFSNAVPDVFDRIMGDIDKNQGNDVDKNAKKETRGITFAEKKSKGRGKLIKGLFAAAAAAAVAVATVFGISSYHATNAVASTVSIDVNPSIEIKVNRDRKVINVIPRTDDAIDVIGTLDFKGADLDVAINALLGSLISKGYLSEIANSILVSVDNADPETASALQDMLMEEIDSMIGSETFSGAIIGQVISEDEELSKAAEEYGITLSKAQLINQITTQNPTLKFDDLVSLSINDLNLLKGDTRGVSSIGDASDEGYIGSERAVSIALEDAGFSKDDTNFLRVGMDYENGALCYKISFHKLEGKLDYDYDYDIEAVSGKIISVEKEIENVGDLPQQDVMGELLSEEAAKEIALNRAGAQGKEIYEYELEYDYDRIAHYDIEFKTDDREFGYSISMYDGSVIDDKWELEEDFIPGADRLPPPSEEEKKSYIGDEAAKKIAFKHADVNEASVYDIEIELERDLGKIIYEVEFKSGIYDYSYDIDPITGDILDYELDFNL